MSYAVGCTVFKCQSCGTVQKVKLTKQGRSARLYAEINVNVETLLSKTGLSIDSKTDEIAEALLGLQNINLKIDLRSKCILK